MQNSPSSKFVSVIKGFFGSLVEAMVLDRSNFGMPVITREVHEHSIHRYILSRDEAKQVYESHLAFCDTVSDDLINEYNNAVLSFHTEPMDAYFAQDEFQKGAWVYLVGTPHGEFKIGWSQAPERRVEEVQSPSGGEKELLHVIRCARAMKVEELLHQVFRNKRIQGEWFRLSPEDVTWLKSISEWP